jgi:hypothetical protein
MAKETLFQFQMNNGMLLNKQTIIKIIDLLKPMEMKDLVQLYRR